MSSLVRMKYGNYVTSRVLDVFFYEFHEGSIVLVKVAV